LSRPQSHRRGTLPRCDAAIDQAEGDQGDEQPAAATRARAPMRIERTWRVLRRRSSISSRAKALKPIRLP